MTVLDLGATDHPTPSKTAPARAWRAWADHRGLSLALGAKPADADSPLALLHRIQEHLRALEVAEKALEAAKAKNPLARIELPPALWAIVGIILLTLILAAEAVVALLGPWAIWAGLALAVATATWTILERKLVDPTTRLRVSQAQDALFAATTELEGRSFVARLDRRVVVHTPHLARLVALAEGLRAAEPDAPVLPALDAAVAEAQARLDALLQQPPKRWTADGLEVDVEQWVQQIDAAG